MHGLKAIAIALAATVLTGVAPHVSFTDAQLILLDPSARAADMCGGPGKANALRAALAAAAAVAQVDRPAPIPLTAGLGKIDFPITTTNPTAQRYFNQGLGYAYGFNHAAAIASFRAAQKLDPGCAMCWWGEALAHGPNINAPLTPDANKLALGTIARAQLLAAKVTPAERALIMALAKRYSPGPEPRAALDAAYADAMLTVARYYPAHDDIALLAAEAAMDTLPWDYWEPDKTSAKPRLGEAITLVERVMARNAAHPQAPHLYIHLMENGPDPKRAEAAADRLAAGLSRDAGHMVHMPSHIYYRLGRWTDSIRVNIAAARQDEAYIRAADDRGFVRFGYYPHNVHFIVTSAQMAGDLPTAIREARRLAGIVDADTAAQLGWVQAIHAAPYFATLQYASSADVLAMPAPDPRLPYVTAMRHYARAVAHAQRRDAAGFEREIAALDHIARSPQLQSLIDQGVPARDLIDLATWVAHGRYAAAGGHYDRAAAFYRKAVTIEDRIPYMEPPYWYYPVRQSLGGALYRAGHYAEARTAFTTALARAPNNGWALYGLAATERALGRDVHAAAAQRALGRAWAGDPRWLRMERL